MFIVLSAGFFIARVEINTVICQRNLSAVDRSKTMSNKRGRDGWSLIMFMGTPKEKS